MTTDKEQNMSKLSFKESHESELFKMGRMILCETCGNKRCPHASSKENACTNSNDPGQPGSKY